MEDKETAIIMLLGYISDKLDELIALQTTKGIDLPQKNKPSDTKATFIIKYPINK